MKLQNFKSIWVIDTEFKADAGELPVLHCLVAREVRTNTIRRWRHDELAALSSPPFPTGVDTLIVGFYLPAEYGCFLQLGWDCPTHSLDLCHEHRWLRSGIADGQSRALIGALTHFNLLPFIPADKSGWREIAMRGAPFTGDEMAGLLDYCQQDVDGTAQLLRAMEPHLDLDRALLRGRYSWHVALMERTGIPLDMQLLGRVREKWDHIRGGLIREIDVHALYVDGHFGEARFGRFLAENGIAWPRLPTGRLALDDDTFRQQARAHPALIAPYHELRSSLSRLKLNSLSVGRDGRNRTMLSPFSATTSRHTPSNSKFIFGPATWIRGLIKPAEGRALAYIDWKQQELGIAAALSRDEAMMAAYNSGDPYLTFAKMAGAVPPDATKRSHGAERAVYKVCMLAVQYGMGAKALAEQTNTLTISAHRLLQAHKDAFPKYWVWSQRVQDHGFAMGRLHTRFGWQRHVMGADSPASVRNFPVQGNGAEMLRLAIMRMQCAGVSVCAPVHDAVLIEADVRNIDDAVRTAQAAMRWASEQVLDGFSLGSDAKVICEPDRYMDLERGLSFWNTIMGLLDGPTYQCTNE